MARYKLKTVKNDFIGNERIIEFRRQFVCDSGDNSDLRGDSVLENQTEAVRFVRFHFRKDKDLL